MDKSAEFYVGDAEGVTGKPQRTYRNVIDVGELPVYEQAAKQTGYGVSVTAREGKEVLVEDKNRKGILRQAEVPPGMVEVAVTVPPGQKNPDTTPFYDAVRALK